MRAFRAEGDYLVPVSGESPGPDDADRLYRLVWRRSLDVPGFALLRPTGPMASQSVRRLMAAVVAGLSRAAADRGTLFQLQFGHDLAGRGT